MSEQEKKKLKVTKKTNNKRCIRVIELDEMWHYCKIKEAKVWVWTAICRDSKKILAYEIGCRGVKTAKKIWEKIKHIPCKCYCTDHWRAYRSIIPEDKHLPSKAETYTVESYNAVFRHYIARFHRKTKCYSKCLNMINNTVSLFIHFLNTNRQLLSVF